MLKHIRGILKMVIWMKTISIIIGKILILIGKIVNKGSTLPGEYALKIDKNLTKKFKLPEKIIAVTGSSGKGSTTAIIRKIFEEQGYTVCHNDSGANLVSGITTTLIDNSNLKGEIKKDIIILEIDERYLNILFKDIKPQILVVTNICRDQPPRQGNVDLVFDKINQGITKDMILIINGDDPYLRKFQLQNKENKIIYYGIEKNKYSYKKDLFKSLNIYYCPICNTKLKYNYKTFEENGDYYCEKCNFKRPEIDYKVTNINYDKNYFIINNKYKIKTQYNILFSIYNTTASFATADQYNLDKEKMAKTLNNIFKNQKIYNEYKIENRKITIINNKNENATTFNQSLLNIKRKNDKKVVVIGWKEISRRYQFNDMSWMYDVDFELLNDENLEKVICIGRDKQNIATRLKYANIDKKKIITFNEIEDATNYIKKNTKSNIYAILNFDYVHPFNNSIRGDQNEQ